MRAKESANMAPAELATNQKVMFEPSDPNYNQYNTEIFKFDATNSVMQPDGNLEASSVAQTSDNLSSDVNLERFARDDYDLFAPNYELVQHLIPVDSVNNKSFTDVTFIVGPPQHSKKYVGHRVLLAMTSPVFETMFYGDMADKSKYIRISDVAPIGFENLLRYAYTDSLNLNSVEDAMLTAYAAKKYLLPQLLRECLTYIEHNINPSTACVVFEFAHVLNSQQLVLQAMNLIDRQTISVITSKSFNHVQATTVEFVANRKYLSLGSEFTLFNSVLSWSLAEARRRNLDPSDWSSIRAIMSEYSILAAVRFLAMSQEEFARAVAKTSATLRLLGSPSAGGEPMGAGGQPQDDTRPNNGQQQPFSAEASQADPQAGGPRSARELVDVEDSNCLLGQNEQRAIFLNLTLGDVAKLPPTINKSLFIRQAPPEYFTLKRFKSSGGGGSSPNFMITTTTTRSIKSIFSKFQCLSENVFIVGLTIPIRLDSSSYANRTPKFECHLKFTTKATNSSSLVGSQSQPLSSSTSSNLVNDLAASVQQQDNLTVGGNQQASLTGTTLLMDTIDESLHISIARDKDCLVRLKRPILVRMGNINELNLTFQTYALDEDIVALRTPKTRSANFSEQTDGENISWLFFKTPGVEFSELHYYY